MENTKKSKVKLFVIIGIIVAVIALVLVLVLCLPKGSGKSNKNKNYSTAFFLREDDKYALFSNDGKKLTGFEFTYAGTIVNGTAIVKKDDAYGVIGSNGKMVVDFGKYKYISGVGALYKVRDNEGNEYLLDSKGKKISDLKNAEVNSYIGENLYVILHDKEAKSYKVLDQDGKAVVSFAEVKDAEKPATNSEDGYVSVFYNDKNYILNLNTGKKVLDFDSDAHYCVNNVSEDEKVITMNTCVGMFEKQDETKYKFIKDNKLYDLSDKCDKVVYSSETLVCMKDNKKYLLDSKLNVGANVDSAAYIDSDHYAKLKDGSFNGVDFYDKDKVVKNVECRTIKEIGYNKNYYVLGTYYSTKCNTTSGKYEFYDKDGNKMFDKTFERINNFDNNSLARVSENKTSYYLINTKGKKVSDEYDSISNNNDNYIVTKNNLKGILNSKGKLVIEPKYKSADIYEIQGVKYAKLTTEDKKYIIYNIDNDKKIMTLDTNPSLAENYIYTITDGKKTYYTYKGKEIYKEK